MLSPLIAIAPITEVFHSREQVFLTNALTGWEPPQKPKSRLPFPGMEEERDAAERVKREQRILVILGNPPYDGFASIAVDEERALTTAYRTVKSAPAPEGQGLNNLFVRFFRMAERRIVEKTGKGVVCFITPYTWLDGRSFTGMRERYLEVFDRIWIDSLNGDKFKTGKLTPDGEPDPSVFSTELNREGIKVGTAIALLVRKEDHAPAKEVLYRDFWGKEKRADLLKEVQGKGKAGIHYQRVEPIDYLGMPFVPMRSDVEYGYWPLLPELFPVSFPGVKTSRDDVVVDISREQLVSRMEKYFDPQVDDEEMRQMAPGAMEDTTLFDARKTRAYLQKRGFLSQNIVHFSYRPFDRRWLYWEPETKLLDRNRPEYFPQVFEGNLWLAAAPQNRKEFNPPYVSPYLCSLHVIERGANLFPLRVRRQTHPESPGQESFSFEPAETVRCELNLSGKADEYLSDLNVRDREEALFYHAVAVLHSPAYASEHAGALSQDWPRIPLPESAEGLLASAALGRKVVTLLNTDVEVSGVTGGNIPKGLRLIAEATRGDSKPIGLDSGDLNINANWGYRNREGAIMPGQGRAEQRDYNAVERAEFNAYARSLGINAAEVFVLLGETTYDVYLNPNVICRNVPASVWRYTIGGYQAIKKWLSFREHKVLGRAISLDELREVTKISRRAAALLLLGPALDASYSQIRLGHKPW
jgi:predicted helicase